MDWTTWNIYVGLKVYRYADKIAGGRFRQGDAIMCLLRPRSLPVTLLNRHYKTSLVCDRVRALNVLNINWLASSTLKICSLKAHMSRAQSFQHWTNLQNVAPTSMSFLSCVARAKGCFWSCRHTAASRHHRQQWYDTRFIPDERSRGVGPARPCLRTQTYVSVARTP
jgi:hypothetical protein